MNSLPTLLAPYADAWFGRQVEEVNGQRDEK
jgi:hypothetical protein